MPIIAREVAGISAGCLLLVKGRGWRRGLEKAKGQSNDGARRGSPVWNPACPSEEPPFPRCRPMLRITIDEKPDTVVLRLEGSLIGPWIKDVEECWRSVFEEFGTRSVQIDLSAVSFMDTEGGALLTRMYNAGFRLKGGSSAKWLPMGDGKKRAPDGNWRGGGGGAAEWTGGGRSRREGRIS